MKANAYLSHLSAETAKAAAGSVAARLLANPAQYARLESIDPTTPAAADLRSMVGPETGFDELVEAIEPGAGHWWTRAAFHDISTAAVQTLARAATPPAHRAFLSVQRAADFKSHTLQFGFFGAELQPVHEGGEFRAYSPDSGLTDTASATITKYGAAVPIMREQLVNDRRLGYLGGMTTALLGSAWRKEAALVFSALESNPNLADGQPWFDATNSTSSGSVLQGLIDAFELFHGQTLPNGELLNASPAVLVIPPGWSIKAADVIGDILLNLGRLTVIKSGSVASGYLFASPAECPAIGLLGLHPDATPDLRIQRRPKSGFLTDQELIYRVCHEIAVVPLSRLGVVKIGVTE